MRKREETSVKRNDGVNIWLPRAAVRWLIVLVASESVVLVASNLAALKIWSLNNVPVDAGIFFFPISYIVGDLLVYIYGRKVADFAAYVTTFFTLLVVGVLFFVGMALPDFPGADNSAFIVVQEAVGRIFCASVLAFLASSLANNYVFEKMRQRDKGDHFRKWELVSSLVARLFDSLLFEFLAFFGKLPVQDFLVQAVWAYIAGMILEVVMSFAAKPLASYSRKRLGFSGGRKVDDVQILAD